MSNSDQLVGRCVVTGIEDGRSTIISDGPGATRFVTPIFGAVDLWQVDALPAVVGSESTLGETIVLDPPAGGLVVRMLQFPPDAEWQGTDAFADAMGEVGAGDTHVDSDVPGMHVTDTVDVLTVVEGEIYVVLEETETLLRVGDSVVQRGTKHAWSNRSDRPAVLVATMMSTTR
ncbi:MAG: cupin domain-containing protein [Rhodococcus sp. (in: high G+C Gram-positive bacteria)]|nr:MAG: cupin domain-containing protein [Rhodococcus sp. (in: high G+C Gram-positive bacteria)]